MNKLIDYIEKGILIVIGACTLWALGQEILAMAERQHVDLKDLLMMFIFAEVIGMIGIFYSSHQIPIKFPIFIAMTATCRAIILEGKEMPATNLVYEAVAILILAFAAHIVSKIRMD